MSKVLQRFCFSLLFCCMLGAQSSQTSDIPGAVAVVWAGDWNPVQGLTGQVPAFNHCDGRGNVYIAVEQPHRYDHRPTLYRVSPDGHIQAKFSQPSLALGNTRNQAFAQNGRVVMLEVAHESEYLLSFGPHGEFLSRNPMQWRSQSGRIGLFPDGKILITYHNRGFGDENHKHDMHTGIYDSQGNLISEIKLPDDEAIQRAVENGDSRFVMSRAADSNLAVDLSELESGTDGNVYLLRGHTNPAIIYVIAPTGELVRRLEINAPFETMRPERLQADKGIVSLQFYDPGTHKRVITVNDWESGARLRLYDLTGVGGVFACFQPETERLTFLSSYDHQISIRFAHPANTAQLQTP